MVKTTNETDIVRTNRRLVNVKDKEYGECGKTTSIVTPATRRGEGGGVAKEGSEDGAPRRDRGSR